MKDCNSRKYPGGEGTSGYTFLFDLKLSREFVYRAFFFFSPLFQETLPGFKWIGSRVKDLLDNGKEVLFAFEESIGMYMTITLKCQGLCSRTVTKKEWS